MSHVRLWCCTGYFTCDISHTESAWLVESAWEWDGSLSLIPSRVVIFHSLQHHFIISIHPFIVYHHSCSTQVCWSLSQLRWGEGLVHPGHLASTLQSQDCEAVLSYFYFHPAGAFLLTCPVLPACHSCVPSSSNPHRHVLTSCISVKDDLSGLSVLVCAALGIPPHNNHICDAFILSAASKLLQNF